VSEELYFNDELRKCLNDAGLSDCGENDAWNYWYHRVHKAHDQAVDRVTEAQRAENAKLRELVEDMHAALQAFCDAQDVHGDNCPLWVERTDDCELRGIERRMSELGVEVDE